MMRADSPLEDGRRNQEVKDALEAIAATEVLEAAGFEVHIPERPLCCGRPLYD